MQQSGRSAIIATHAGIIRILQARFMDIPHRKIAFLDAPQDRVMMLRAGIDEFCWF
jgi:broad specificity phosphatase PhoE